MNQNKGLDYSYYLNVLLVGDSKVGKSSIFNRITKNSKYEWNDTFDPTIGVDFFPYYGNFADTNVKVVVWDLSGNERFLHVTQTYFSGAHGIMYIYDITDMTSFQNIEKWGELQKRKCYGNVKRVLVGNKCELDKERIVSFDEGKEKADKLGMQFFEVSAKMQIGIKKAFASLVQDIVEEMKNETKHEKQKSDKIILSPDPSIQPNSRCF